MNCMCDKRKLPNFVDCEPLKCAKILMSNDEEYIVKIDDLVAIQFIKNDEKILVRRGRIKDIIIVNIYAPNTEAPQYIKQMLTDKKLNRRRKSF